MNSDVSDFIGVFEGAYPKEFCDEVIDSFKTCEERGYTKPRSFQSDNKSMMDDSMLFAADVPTDHMKPGIHTYFLSVFWDIYKKFYADKYYAALTAASAEHSIYSIKVQKTEPSQGYHVWHYESSSRESGSRLLAFIMYLNDVDEGGETEFLYYSRRVKPEAGKLLLFPAGFTHLHRGNPPLSGDKYILTGWVDF